MAIASTTAWEVRTTGSDSNGGGYDSAGGGTDYSQQDAAQVVINNSTITCTTPAANSNTLTFTAGYTPSANDVGNIVQITGGTNVNTGFYEITAQTSTTWTLTGATNLTTAGGAGSAITGNMGGALASPGEAGGAMVGGNDVWIKSGTYTITSATANVSGGCMTLPAGTVGSWSKVIGYGATRGDGGTKPLLQASAISTFTIINASSANLTHVENLSVDGASLTSSRGISGGSSNSRVINCKAANCTNAAFSGGNLEFCEATGCSSQSAFNAVALAFCCVAHGNSIHGFINGTCVHCISYGNTGTNGNGFLSGAATANWINCIAYNNAGAGFQCSSTGSGDWINCIATGNTGKGFDATATNDSYFYNCAAWSNTGGNWSTNFNAAQQINCHALSGDPFTNAVGGDFSLNNTAGAGATCRAAGIPGLSSSLYTFPGLSTNAYPDIGAAQHQDAGGAAGILVTGGMTGGLRG